MRYYPHPVFNVQLPEWWRWQAQMPPGVILYLIPALVGLLVPQRWMRPYLLTTSLLMIWLTFGYGFTGAILLAVLAGWGLCLAGRAAAGKGRGWARGVLIGGWILANAVYFSMFALPIQRMLVDATPMDILLLCGPGFLLIRVLGLFTDLCRGQDRGSLRLDRFVLFLLFAPTFRLGPVTEYAALNDQVDRCKSQVNKQAVIWGLIYVGIGLLQLVLVRKGIDEWLTDRFHERTFFLTRSFFVAAPHLHTWELVLGMYLIAFRLLLGFSGYSHVAIGVSGILGVRLAENFNWPYLAQNIQDLWRRWHISLSQWLRDYIYIPLGGKHRRALATLAVFVYCLAWHQPTVNMIVFALLQTAGILAYQAWRTRFPPPAVNPGWLRPIAGGLITFHFWCLSLLVFADPAGCGLGVMKRILVDPFFH